MNISDLTDKQRKDVLHHLRCAVLAHATQWDNDRQIESILDREIDISETIEDLATSVDADAATITPDDLTFIRLEDLTTYIPDEDNE